MWNLKKKNGRDDLTEIETQTQRTNVWKPRRIEGVVDELGDWGKHI